MEPTILRIDTSKSLSTVPRPTVASFQIYPLIKENDHRLKTPCLPFDFTNPPLNPEYLGISLFETMFANKGLGLTANQCGIPWSVFVVGADMSNKQIFFNPKITSQSDKMVKIMEGCLSFPQLFFKVERPEWIEIEYQHVNGEVRTTKFGGMTARIVAHEYDHILGKTFDDLVGGLAMKMAKDKRAKLKKKLSRAS